MRASSRARRPSAKVFSDSSLIALPGRAVRTHWHKDPASPPSRTNPGGPHGSTERRVRRRGAIRRGLVRPLGRIVRARGVSGRQRRSLRDDPEEGGPAYARTRATASAQPKDRRLPSGSPSRSSLRSRRSRRLETRRTTGSIPPETTAPAFGADEHDGRGRDPGLRRRS